MWPAAGGAARVQVSVRPEVPPVEVYAFPASLAPHVSLGLRLPSATSRSRAWVAAKAAAMAETGGSCAVTGGPLAAAHERWEWDDGARVLRLVGLRAEAPEVQQVGGLLELEQDAAVAAAGLLQRLNSWSNADTVLYLGHQMALRQARSAQPWRLDLRWLAERGVSVPAKLQPLCV
jgi:hypothetical protein